jgi:deazaflavin-dependent oxidoreductase (nitroreductase family)
MAITPGSADWVDSVDRSDVLDGEVLGLLGPWSRSDWNKALNGASAMAKEYRISVGTRTINWVFRQMTTLGIGASYRRLLTVQGRKTGREYSTPVDVMDHDGSLWLVAAYGVTSWVKNLRTAGSAMLSRGRRSERFSATEVDGAEAIPVLRQYMREVRVTRPYFDAPLDAPDDVLAAELPRHPVFRLTQLT